MQQAPGRLASLKPWLFRSSCPTFVSQFLRNPKEIGSIVPSSPFLGRAMSEFVPDVDDRFIVELGPGTGPITMALLEMGIYEEDLFCLEQSERLVEHLRRRFPLLDVVQGNARDLNELLMEKSGNVNAIVSSLPLRSFPESVLVRIIDEMGMCLEPGGIVIQYTYDLRKSRSPLLGAFNRVDSKMVMGNFPPARVDVFEMN